MVVEAWPGRKQNGRFQDSLSGPDGEGRTRSAGEAGVYEGTGSDRELLAQAPRPECALDYSRADAERILPRARRTFVNQLRGRSRRSVAAVCACRLLQLWGL